MCSHLPDAVPNFCIFVSMNWRKGLLVLLAMSFLVRLVNITAPPLERSHSWRQATGLMVARNFSNGDSNILRPQIDERADTTGHINMELPLLPWIHGQLGKWLGYSHWYSRLINLLFVTAGLWCFYLILARWHTERLAATATAVLTMSMWFSFGRKSMPDTFSCAIVLMGIEHVLRAMERGALWRWVVAAALLSIGALSKLPAAVLMFPLPLLWRNESTTNRMFLTLTGIVVLASVGWWYGYHGPKLGQEAGTWFHQGQSLAEALSSLGNHARELADRFVFSALRTYTGFAAALLGLWTLVRHRARWNQTIWGFSALSIGCVLLMLRAGFYFHHHDYYIMPFVPAMALIAAVGLETLPIRWASAILILIGLESGLNQQHDFWVPEGEKVKLDLVNLAQDQIPSGGHVVVIGEGNPLELYLLNRKGWVHDPSVPFVSSQYTQYGPTWLLIPQRHASEFQSPAPLQYRDEQFALYNLN